MATLGLERCSVSAERSAKDVQLQVMAADLLEVHYLARHPVERACWDGLVKMEDRPVVRVEIQQATKQFEQSMGYVPPESLRIDLAPARKQVELMYGDRHAEYRLDVAGQSLNLRFRP